MINARCINESSSLPLTVDPSVVGGQRRWTAVLYMSERQQELQVPSGEWQSALCMRGRSGFQLIFLTKNKKHVNASSHLLEVQRTQELNLKGRHPSQSEYLVDIR